MLPFDHTREGLVYPGRGLFFDGLALNLVPFEPQRRDFSLRNAWWLAELSRVMYRGAVSNDEVVLPGRRTLLQNAGLREAAFFAKEGSEGALVRAPGFDVLVFRGTDELTNWLENLKFDFDPAPSGKGRVHSGFNMALDRIWPGVEKAVKDLRGPLFVTGHSLGAAMAVLAGARLGRSGIACSVYAYGCPRVGNAAFVQSYPSSVTVHRIVNDNDAVATVPPAILGYEHVGQARCITEDGRLVPARPTSNAMLAKRLLRFIAALKEKRDVPIPDCVSDHAPVNYVAWLQRLAAPRQ